MKKYIQFRFETTDPEVSGRLIALLDEQGFEGFEESGKDLLAFILEEKFIKEDFEKIAGLFIPLVYTRSIIEETNWNQQWEESFEPVVIDGIVAIRAGFHQPMHTPYEIIVTPKMSFGTGHHATTYLMVQTMLSLDFKNKTVADFGTGTGVLAILAEKLGAGKIVAIDNDDWCITNAKENIQQNGCVKIDLQKGTTLVPNQKSDIILANINLNIILDNISSIKDASEKGTKILLSGFLKEDEQALLNAIEPQGFMHVATYEKSGWIAILAHSEG